MHKGKRKRNIPVVLTSIVLYSKRKKKIVFVGCGLLKEFLIKYFHFMVQTQSYSQGEQKKCFMGVLAKAFHAHIEIIKAFLLFHISYLASRPKNELHVNSIHYDQFNVHHPRIYYHT